ncbi:MAG: tetratricopeptide repeat protein [Sphingobacteriales bacterium JAD_PAG50586_3]|nr:MAG: tetratricopeptide repeat protein [Sphingobacteriales bacterium JAD_PAG50586_3]
MAEDHRLSKVEILIQQKKFADAESILSDLLAGDSNNIHFLSLLAEVNFQQDKYDNAHSIINHAIGLSPDEPHLFYIKSRIALHQDQWDEAQDSISQAIELDPYDADYYALLAHIRLGRKQYSEALETANTALEIDAENILALNTRSSALNKLNRTDESFETIEGALRNDPNNAYTHTNYGWGLLEKGDHKKALEHFKEALANDPNFDYAQAGMLEAIKAANPVYRMFLKYSFWMSNMTAKYQWGVIIGFFIGFRALRILARTNPTLQPYLMPLIIGLGVIAFSTWIMEPISNLFLRFNKYGQLLLDKKEKMSSNFVALSAAISITGLVLYLALSDEKMLTITAFGFIMMLPLGTMFSPSKNQYALLIYAVALAVVGIIAIMQTFSTGIIINSMSAIFFLGFVAFQWIANYLLIKEDNH